MHILAGRFLASYFLPTIYSAYLDLIKHKTIALQKNEREISKLSLLLMYTSFLPLFTYICLYLALVKLKSRVCITFKQLVAHQVL